MGTTTDALWRSSRQKLYSYVRARSRSPQDADDILQDVFVKVCQRIDTVADEAQLMGWLYRVTHNTIVDFYRKKHPQPVGLEPTIPLEEDPCETEQQLAPFMREVIDGLPPIYRDALTLTEFDGLTQQEMGERLGLSTSGAKSRVQRGRALVKTRLLECCSVELDRRGHVIDYEPRRPEAGH